MIDENELFEVLNSEHEPQQPYVRTDYKFALENLIEGRLVVHMLRHGFYPSEICSTVGVPLRDLSVGNLVLLLERALFEVHIEAASPDKSIFRLLERLSEVRDLIRQNPNVGNMSSSELFEETLSADMQILEQRVKGACHGRC